MSKFYFFSQNNSGGDFVVDDNVAEYVIIEADNYEQANDKAEDVGIYFDGCRGGMDCPCCGDRWGEVDESDSSDVPSIYNTPIDQYKGGIFSKEYRIHYANGNIEKGKVEKLNKN
jgi:hypothetical protein